MLPFIGQQTSIQKQTYHQETIQMNVPTDY